MSISAASPPLPPPSVVWHTAGKFRYAEGSLHARQERRLHEIAAYFDDAALLRLLLPVATSKFDVSLRLLDYCCTNYAKKTRVVLCGRGMATHLFSLYKDWLRYYRRRCFDPFRRRERILFTNPCDPEDALETTVAQLNFLRWAELYDVLSYVRRHLQTIEADMMRTLTESKKRRLASEAAPSQDGKRKRAELSKAPPCKCTVYFVPGSLAFGA